LPKERWIRAWIDQAQFLAGREFQRHFEIADKRRPADLQRVRPGNLADEQLAAWKAQVRCYRALGADGSALVNDVLIDAKTTKQIVESRAKRDRTRRGILSGGSGNASNTFFLEVN
jgi:hypothetical protein